MSRFEIGSWTHWGVIAAVLGLTVGVCVAGRRARDAGRPIDRAVAFGLGLIWVLELLYNFTPGRLRWGVSLPLHVCDVVGLLAAFALWTGRRLPRAVVFYWGTALCSQAFITPVLFKGPTHPDFWAYWFCHGAIVTAASFDVAVNRFRPTWADWRHVVLCGTVYAALILPVNVRLGVNYGYMGRGDFCQAAAVTMFGQWPARIPRMLLAVFGLTAAMTAPFEATVPAVLTRGLRATPTSSRL